MSKAIISVVILIIGIEMALWLFTGVTGGSTNNSLFQLVLDPVSALQWNGSTFTGTAGIVQVIQLALLGYAAASIIIGSVFFKQDSAVFSGIAAIMMTFIGSLVKLYQFIFSSLGGDNMHAAILSTSAANIVAMLACGPLLIFYIFTVLDWMRAHD